MKENPQTSDARKSQRVRLVLLTLALLTSPALCCGGLQLLDALPSSSLPASVDGIVNLFESTARIENSTAETFYITAITTTYGDPRVIPQYSSFRQHDIPLRPGSSIKLQYDAADLPLTGIVVGRNAQDCRQLPASRSNVYELSSYESLEKPDPDWLQSVQASRLYNYGSLMVAGLGLVSILLFLRWAYLKQQAKNQ